MEKFFSDKVLLRGEEAEKIYAEIKDLPIIDFHCHLDEKKIEANSAFSNIGELWLAGDHYKWRAMRLCGVDEHFITGDASYEEKFFKYAEILPLLVGSPVYHWTHFELKEIFGINEPLDKVSAPRIWKKANEVLKSVRVRDLLKKFRVQYVATTDDPLSPLASHGKYDDTTVAPTFRPDKLLTMDLVYIAKLGNVKTLSKLKDAVRARLDHFQSKGGKLADVGFDFIPKANVTEEEAAEIYESGDESRKAEYFSYMLGFLASELCKRGMILQLHIGTFRNVNEKLYAKCGADAGFDVMRTQIDVDALAALFNDWSGKDALPVTILYPLNDSVLRPLTTLSGAFRRVYVGAAWWFNDTKEGVLRQLETVSQFAALGTNFGMVSDSRSFSSYVRFDFFRRILASYLGGLVCSGEYPLEAAVTVAKKISYYNIKEALGLR